MQIDVLGATLGGQRGHGENVILMAVHAARREQAEQVHGTAGGDGGIDGCGQHGVAGQLVVLDGLGDAREVLIDDAPGAEVHVADFGVAHLAVGQPDILAVGVQQGGGIALLQRVHDRRPGAIDGVVLGVVVLTVAIEDQQRDGTGTLGVGICHNMPRGNLMGVASAAGRR